MLFFEIIPLTGFLLFAAMIFRRTTTLKQRGIKTGKHTNKTNFQKYLLFPLYFFFILMIILELLQPLFQYSILPNYFSDELISSIYLKISGTLLIFFSVIFMNRTLKDFNNSLRFGLNKKNLGNIVTSGSFAISRNPFFMSIEIYFFGVTFLFFNLFFISLTLLAVVSIHFFILKEEIFLRENYGNEYKNYSKKVRRYF